VIRIKLLILFLVLHFSFASAQDWLNFPSNRTGSEYVKAGNLNVPGHKITVEAMITLSVPDTSAQPQEDVVSKHYDTTDVNYLLRAWCFVLTTSSGYAVLQNPVFISINTPYHIAGTYDGDSMKYYLNGCEVGSMAWSGDMIQNIYSTAIGNRYYPRNEQFPGYIDEVRIWNVARTQDEIALNMDSLPFPAEQAGLLAYYKFNGNLLNAQGNTTLNGVRQGIINHSPNPYWNGVLANLCNLLIADFSVSDTTICTDECINFADHSVNAINWQWRFEGGTPSSSTDKNPQNICYYSSGNYNVTLIVTNDGPVDSVTFTNYIHVANAPPSPVISKVGTILHLSHNSLYSSYQWYNDTTLIPRATDSLLTITKEGNYKVEITSANGCMVSAIYNSILGLQIISSEGSEAYFIYPNPATKELIIRNGADYRLQGDEKVEIFSLQGKLLKAENMNIKREITFNIESIPAGVYFIMITSEKRRWAGKFIKE
jgi:hypothetical protein